MKGQGNKGQTLDNTPGLLSQQVMEEAWRSAGRPGGGWGGVRAQWVACNARKEWQEDAFCEAEKQQAQPSLPHSNMGWLLSVFSGPLHGHPARASTTSRGRSRAWCVHTYRGQRWPCFFSFAVAKSSPESAVSMLSPGRSLSLACSIQQHDFAGRTPTHACIHTLSPSFLSSPFHPGKPVRWSQTPKARKDAWGTSPHPAAPQAAHHSLIGEAAVGRCPCPRVCSCWCSALTPPFP